MSVWIYYHAANTPKPGWFEAKWDEEDEVYAFTDKWIKEGTQNIRYDSGTKGKHHNEDAIRLVEINNPNNAVKTGHYMKTFPYLSQPVASKKRKAEEEEEEEIVVKKKKTKEIKIVVGKKKEQIVTEECLKGYEIKNILGKGGYGGVYVGCDIDNNCTYAVKFMANKESFLNEHNIVSKISVPPYNIGPKYHGSWWCNEDGIGMIVTDRWTKQLPENKCLPLHLFEKLKKQIELLHSLGYVHCDILEKNVLIKYQNNKIVDVTLTDFGLTDSKDELMKNPKWIKALYKYHILSQHTTQHMFKEKEITLNQVKKDPNLLDFGLLYHLKKMCSKKKI
jgi:hypothetical protein